MPYYNRDPKRGHNFDNRSCGHTRLFLEFKTIPSSRLSYCQVASHVCDPSRMEFNTSAAVARGSTTSFCKSAVLHPIGLLVSSSSQTKPRPKSNLGIKRVPFLVKGGYKGT